MATQQNFFSFMEPPAAPREATGAARLTADHSAGRDSLTATANPLNPPPSADSSPATRNPANPNSVLTKTPALSRKHLVESLRQKVGAVGAMEPSTGRRDTNCFSSGCDTIDTWLPRGGLHPATLTEWVAAHDSAAAGSLAMVAAAHRLDQVPNRPLIVVDCEGTLYPPAIVALGVPSERVILLRPRSGNDALWAIDQSLRCGAVAAVWAALPMRLDDRDARRLQLASETGQTPGLLVRNFSARGKPSFAEVQFYVCEKRRVVAHRQRQLVRSSPLSSSAGDSSSAARSSAPLRNHSTAKSPEFETLTVTLDRVRGGPIGRQIDVRIDDDAVVSPVSQPSTPEHETAAQHLASQLAHPEAANASAGGKRNATERDLEARRRNAS